MPRRTDTIAFFDDDADTVEAYKRTFEHDGYTFLSAPSPKAALELYESIKDTPPRFTIIDVIFKSFSTDKTNGFGLCRQLREIDPGGIFIVLTGLEDSLTRIRLIDSKADVILEKPKSDVQILAAVTKIEREREEARVRLQAPKAAVATDRSQWGMFNFSGRECVLYALNFIFIIAVVWFVGRMDYQLSTLTSNERLTELKVADVREKLAAKGLLNNIKESEK